MQPNLAELRRLEEQAAEAVCSFRQRVSEDLNLALSQARIATGKRWDWSMRRFEDLDAAAIEDERRSVEDTLRWQKLRRKRR